MSTLCNHISAQHPTLSIQKPDSKENEHGILTKIRRANKGKSRRVLSGRVVPQTLRMVPPSVPAQTHAREMLSFLPRTTQSTVKLSFNHGVQFQLKLSCCRYLSVN